MILCFERFGPLLDWAMIILNPLEPWPGQLVLPAAVKHEIDLITRVVDYGGISTTTSSPATNSATRPSRLSPRWMGRAAQGKIDVLRPIAERHNLTMLQLACVWNLRNRPSKASFPR